MEVLQMKDRNFCRKYPISMIAFPKNLEVVRGTCSNHKESADQLFKHFAKADRECQQSLGGAASWKL